MRSKAWWLIVPGGDMQGPFLFDEPVTSRQCARWLRANVMVYSRWTRGTRMFPGLDWCGVMYWHATGRSVAQ